MEDTVRVAQSHFAAPVGTQKSLDANIYRPPHLTTPKKGLTEADYSQWNMWADEKSRSNPAVR